MWEREREGRGEEESEGGKERRKGRKTVGKGYQSMPTVCVCHAIPR